MKHYHFREVSSTNDFARELLKYEPYVYVTADYQLAGRGRKDRKWDGKFAQNLYMSIGINHRKKNYSVDPVVYQALGCLASIESLEELTGASYFKLKYPNDVVIIDGSKKFRKISGVIAEHSFVGQKCTETIIGIGINVEQKEFDEELKEKAVSLTMLGFDITVEQVMNKLIEVTDNYMEKKPEDVFNEWKKLLDIEGKFVKFADSDTLWKVKNIMNDGRLQLAENSGSGTKIADNGDSFSYNIY